MLGGEAVIQTKCPVSDASIQMNVNSDGPEAGVSGVVHFAVPAAQWWEDIGYT